MPTSTRLATVVGIAQREKLYAPLKILAVLRTLGALGVDEASLLAGTGLGSAEVANAQTRTSVMQYLAVCRNAARLSPDPAWAVAVGSNMHLTAYGMYGYVLACADTLRRATEMATRYHRLATPVMPLRLVEDEARAAWIFPGIGGADLPDLDESLFRSLLEIQVAVHVTLTRDVMGAWCAPTQVRFALPRPAHASALESSLECAVEFGQPQTELHYPRAWLDRPTQFANPITAQQVSATCERLLEEQKWGCGLTRRVYQELMRTPGRFPDIDEVAQLLGMATRTLRRKLDEEGASYSGLLTSVRHALAIDYLSTSLLDVEDIAAALGFSEVAGFRHAFKRWTGKTPSEYRQI
ncbi:MAG: AraC family transcriptional regulator [Burkholderiales bacterium]|nr:AraC family transcriptional regulator [Burkholderiales bacterium]MDE2396749.1 AraC family transcriptional regulator [Burkholderiales bacterium]MDE2456599.1 AraC family transcriptional regulator [Burkholderiales bacterium]